MVATYTYADAFSEAGVGTNGITVQAWKASRFGSPPAFNASLPVGSPDATATTATSNGQPGGFRIALPTSDPYYLSANDGVNTYWIGPVRGLVLALFLIYPSGDTTGVTDWTAIQGALNLGGCFLAGASASNPFWVNAQLTIPDGTHSSLPGGFLIGQGEFASIIKQAAGTALMGPIVTTVNASGTTGTPSSGSHAVYAANFGIDVNAQNQGYTSTVASDVAWGPDGITTFNSTCHVENVRVFNPVRHGHTVSDTDSAGHNSGAHGFDCHFNRCNVDGWALNNTPPSTTATLSVISSAPYSYTVGSATGISIGMSVAADVGIMPGTYVTNVVGNVVTFNQSALVSASATLRFAWGQRGFWVSNGSSFGMTDSWYTNSVARELFGDVGVKFDVAGDWKILDNHPYALAYSMFRADFAGAATIKGNTWDNGGQVTTSSLGSSCQAATLNQTLVAGTQYGSAAGATITVDPLPCAVAKYQVLVMRGVGPGGDPLAFVTASASPAGATTLTVFSFVSETGASPGQAIMLPIIGSHISQATQTSINQVQINEGSTAAPSTPSGDYIYFAYVAFNNAGPQLTMGQNTIYKGAVGPSLSSIGEVFLYAEASGIMEVIGAGTTSVVQGPGASTPPTTRFQANGQNSPLYSATASGGSGIITFNDGGPGGDVNDYTFTTGAGQWVVPVTGLWRLRAQGSDGGGAGGPSPATAVQTSGGGGGGAGMLDWQDVFLTVGTTLRYSVGSGGAKGLGQATPGGGNGAPGSSGTKSTIEDNGNTILYACGMPGSGGAAGQAGAGLSAACGLWGMGATGTQGTQPAPGSGGVGISNSAGTSTGPAVGECHTGGGGGGAALATGAANIGGLAGTSGYAFPIATSTTTVAVAPGGANAASGSINGQNATAGTGGGGGGGAGSFNGGGGAQGVGGDGAPGANGLCRFTLLTSA